MKSFTKAPIAAIAHLGVAEMAGVLPQGESESAKRARSVAEDWRRSPADAADAIALAFSGTSDEKGVRAILEDAVELSADGRSAFVNGYAASKARDQLVALLKKQHDDLELIRSGSPLGDIFAHDFRLRTLTALTLAVAGACAATRAKA